MSSGFDNEHFFQCPYCARDISIFVDPSGGRQQSFISDCEVCCRPIVFTLEFDGEELTQFDAVKEM